MADSLRGILSAVCACVLLGMAGPALAAADRMGDEVPEATPDLPGALSFGWNYEALDLEGAFQNQRSTVNDFKLRYTFNPKVAATIHYQTDDLPGGASLISPIFDEMDSATGYIFDLGLNLLNQPATPADPANNVAWTAGSSFGLGLRGSFFRTSADALSQNNQLLQAYLVYTTDLTEEMRAHTVFSSGRLGGDGSSGSVNRIGAGLDYQLIKGRRPLTLMVDGILDIYNFRKPDFNTSRVSRFNLGMRYRVAEDFYATAGWRTVNDSESDLSGSGFFLGINYVNEPPDKPKVECPPEEAPPAEGEPAQAALPPGAPPSTSSPTLMASAPQSAGFLGNLGSDTEIAPLAADPAVTPSRAVSAAGSATEVAPAPFDSSNTREDFAADPAIRDTDGYQRDGNQPAAESLPVSADGVAIPPFPTSEPRATPPGVVMVRAGARDGMVRGTAAPVASEPAPPVPPPAGAAGTLELNTSMAGEVLELAPLSQPEAAAAAAPPAASPELLRLPLSDLMELAFGNLPAAPASAFVRPPAPAGATVGAAADQAAASG